MSEDIGQRTDAPSLLEQATRHLEQEEFLRARPLLEQAERSAGELQDSRTLGLVQLQLCRLERFTGNLGAAWRQGHRGLRLLRNNGRREDVTRAMIYLGNVCLVRRDLKRAMTLYRDALAVADEAVDDELVWLAQYNIGNTFTITEQWEAAESHLRQALGLPRIADWRRRVQLDISRAVVCWGKGELDRGMELLDTALSWVKPENRPRPVSIIYNNTGLIYAAAGQWETAHGYYHQTMKLLGGRKTSQLVEARRESVRVTLQTGDVLRACRDAAVALDLAEEVGDRLEYGQSALMYGEALLAAGNCRQARACLLSAEQTLESLGATQSAQRAVNLLAQCSRRRRRFIAGTLLLNSSRPE